MRFDTTPHPCYGGIALHARPMSVCMLTQDGEMVGHRHMNASPAPLLKTLAPSRDERGMAVACVCPWSWPAALGAREGLPCGLGHTLALPALHGGTATNATSDTQKMAGVLRGGRRPQASGSPGALRASRALRWRRTPWMRQHAALLAPLQHPTRQSPLPEMGHKMASTAHRHGGAARCADPAGPKRLAVALARLGHDAPRLRAGERPAATRPSRSMPRPGLGGVLAPGSARA